MQYIAGIGEQAPTEAQHALCDALAVFYDQRLPEAAIYAIGSAIMAARRIGR